MEHVMERTGNGGGEAGTDGNGGDHHSSALSATGSQRYHPTLQVTVPAACAGSFGASCHIVLSCWSPPRAGILSLSRGQLWGQDQPTPTQLWQLVQGSGTPPPSQLPECPLLSAMRETYVSEVHMHTG